MPKHTDMDADTISAVLEEGGKFASEVIFPLNQIGDQQGCTLNRDTHEVKTPDGFKAAYAQYVAGAGLRSVLTPHSVGKACPWW